MKKITELSKSELFHIASLVSGSYIYNFNTFEYVTSEAGMMLGANNCIWLLLKHDKGELLSVSHKSETGWVEVHSKDHYEVMSYLKDLNYLKEDYSLSTKISIDDSIKMLKVALDKNVTFDEDYKEEFLLDVVDSYKQQLNENYGK